MSRVLLVLLMILPIALSASLCDSTCDELCTASSDSNSCLACASGEYLYVATHDDVIGFCAEEDKCVDGNYFHDAIRCYLDYECPDGTYADSSNECQACESTCLTCAGALATDCLSCPKDLNPWFVKTHAENGRGTCSSTCASGYYTDGVDCNQCHSDCSICYGPSKYDCFACATDGYILHYTSDDTTDANTARFCLDECSYGVDDSDINRCNLNGVCTDRTRMQRDGGKCVETSAANIHVLLFVNILAFILLV